ncbi:hypothetical protein [Dyadobacter sandarakinus]|uniref:Uncharacterized protein n=1 Tax=Dyadobacter sandarakinus TaxID=2747268 RepID=A0ABX7I1M1_9BACT|nr:hypothetical protein [Dyadobacter sandarakinus]QRQ99767.1 hypothetical protein HWI92_01945 [Dyadobacter sandarakinus]
MNHVPFFWKDKNFPGWDKFLVTYLKNKNTPMTLDEICSSLAPSNKLKIYGSIAGRLSRLTNNGKVSVTSNSRARGRQYFIPGEIAQTSQLSLVETEPRMSTEEITIIPRAEYHKKRIDDLINAVFKSFDRRKPISTEWIEEYNDLIK